MRKLSLNFLLPKKYATKLIKIQFKYMDDSWLKANVKIVSQVLAYVQDDYWADWLQYDGSPEGTEKEAMLMNEDEIRVLNSDFNY